MKIEKYEMWFFPVKKLLHPDFFDYRILYDVDWIEYDIDYPRNVGKQYGVKNDYSCYAAHGKLGKGWIQIVYSISPKGNVMRILTVTWKCVKKSIVW